MAKANKKDDVGKSSAAESTVKSPAKAARKPSVAARKTSSAIAGVSPIDTNLAAQNAARLVANRDQLANTRAENQQESSAFKQLKESINKPAAHGPGSFLQSTAPQKKSSQPFGGFNQVGKNQTFGADVNRSGVPRRTGG